MLISRLLPLIIGVCFASYIFIDCYKKNRPLLGACFALSSFFPLPIGPIVYFALIKPNLSHKIKNDSASFCSKCGFSTNKNLDICPNCQNNLKLH